MAIDKNTITKDAQKFVAKGQYDKAIAEWKKLLKETPNDPNIYNTIGDLCLKKNAKADAVDAYKQAADILAEDGFTSKAIALYKKVLNIDINKIEVHLALGDMNAEKGLTGNALENYKFVADHYTRNKETAKALDIYQKMADLNPSNVAFQIKLGDMYAKEGMPVNSTKAYLAAADVHMNKGSFTDARHLFEKVLALDPDNKEVYHKAGIVYMKEGKFVEACKAFKPVFENDPANLDIAGAYVEALAKAGRDAEAEQAIRKILADNPGHGEFREKLYHLYLARKDYDKAIVEAGTIADAKIESGNTEGAEELYKAFVAGSPHYAPGRQKMAEFYVSVDRQQEAVAELLRAADLFVEAGDLQAARAVLGQATEIAPDRSEARELLEQLNSQESTAPPPALEFTQEQEPVPAAPPSPPVPEPGPTPVAPKPVLEKEDPAIIEAFAEADVLVKYGLAAKAIEQLETLSSRFPEHALIRIRLRDLYFEQGDRDKAVKHALLAIALHTKYGRKDEASIVLQATRKMAPEHPAVLARIGGTAVPVEPDVRLPEVSGELDLPGDPADRFDTSLAAPENLPPSPDEAAGTREPPPADEIIFDALDSGMFSPEESLPAAMAPDAGPREMEPQPFDEIPPFAEPPSDAGPPGAEQPSLEEELAGGLEQELIAPARKAVGHEPPPEVDISEIWAEAEFYFQQGLFDAAKKHYAQIIELTPGDRRAIERLSELTREEDETRVFTRLTEAVEGLEGEGLEGVVPSVSTEETLPTSLSDQEAVRSLLQEIQQLKQKPVSPPSPQEEKKIADLPPQAPAEAVRRPVEPAKQAEEDFFDLAQELEREELQREAASADTRQKEAASADAPLEDTSFEDFFDLAAELRDDLSSVPVSAQPAVPEEEQSLDDIFEEFKKGVEQQSSKEEADTHYNLGVAYKEMGLLDDAIGELVLTHEHEPKFVQGRYMLGLCHMEKGEYQNAISEILNALEASERLEANAENRIAMRYDLGLAYQGAGNISGAMSEFQKVADEDPGYRDTAAKLKELRKGDFISFEQLRDDIEKEISSKFLEEGERIEREERNRKSDRIIKT